MRKTYLFALLAMILVVAFAGYAIAEPMTIAEQKAQEEASIRPTVPMQGSLTGSRTVLDETVIYETTFENANDWTIEDGGSDGLTWTLSDTAIQADRPMFRNEPFMWVDSDEDGGDSDHFIEGLVSPVIDPATFSHIYVVADIEYDDLSVADGDSAMVQYSNDGGSTWTTIDILLEDVHAYPKVYDISAIASGNGTFQIRFLYDDNGTWAWFMGVDNFQVIGNDGPADFEPPEINITAGPSAGFPGVDRPVVAIATDNFGIDSATLKYGLVVNDAVPEIISLPMTATGNADEYTATIPGTVGAVGDTIAFLVEAEDAAGHINTDTGGGSAYIFEIFPAEYNVNYIPVDYSFTDISETGTLIAIADTQTDFIDFTTVEGIDSFDWFGETFTELSVCSNGWIAFGHQTSAASTPTIGSTSTPNSFLSACSDDLDVDEDGSGKIYWEMVDGKLIVQFGTPTAGAWQYLKTFGPTFQYILDPVTSTVLINYHTMELMDGEDPYTGTHKCGLENPDGDFGVVLYDGTDWTFPTDESSYLVTPPFGSLSGVVYEADGTTVISGATINIYEADGDEILFTATSAEDGAYGFPVVTPGTYDVEFIATGFESALFEDVEIADGDAITQDASLTAQSVTTEIHGVVNDADVDQVVAGIDVTLVELSLTETTGTDGSFSFGDQVIGTYTFEISHDPAGSADYHDVTYANVVIAADEPALDFEVHQIGVPENLTVSASFGLATLSFDPPANHMEPEVLLNMIEELEVLVNAHNQGLKDVADIDEISLKLERLQSIYNELTSGSSLDEIEDFAGYRVKQDGTLLDTVYPDSPITITDVEDGTQYSFEVAADYGYGDDYLAFTDPVVVTPESNPYRYETTAYNWVEIRTNDLGTRVPWTTDDDYSGMIEFAGGATFSFYGVPYSEFNIGSNGFLSFTQPEAFGDFCPYSEEAIPDTSTPNTILAVHWDWTEINDEDAYSAYYYFDSDNNNVIVTWYCPEWNSSPVNMLEYQVVMNLDTDEIVYNYNSSSLGWPASVIGVEGQDGSFGTQYEEDTAADGLALLFTQAPEITGTISGVVKEENASGNPIGGVEVWSDGYNEAVATTETDGSFSAEVRVGTHNLTFVHDNFWAVNEDDVSVTEDNDTDIGDVYMVQPDPSVSPQSFDITHNLYFDDPTTRTFDLSNDGSGPMEYSIAVSFANGVTTSEPGQPIVRGEMPEAARSLKANRSEVGPILNVQLDEIWDSIHSYTDIEDGTGAQDNFGYAMGSSEFYVAGFYYGTISIFAYDGTFQSQVDVDATMNGTNYDGVFGMGNDPDGYLYGGNDDGDIFKFTPDMSEVVNVGTLSQMPTSVTYDWDGNYIYATNWGDPFYRMHPNGTPEALAAPAGSVYGLAYVPMDPDGYTIYAHVETNPTSIIRYNPSTNTWDETAVATIYTLVNPSAEHGDNCGDLATAEHNGSFEFLTAFQGGSDGTGYDLADLREGYALQQWLTVSPAEGTVQSAGSQQITVTINPAADENFAYEEEDEVTAYVTITGPHMDATIVVVDIEFINTSAEEVAGLPTEYTLHQNYPNPFNPTTEIKFDLVEAQSVKLVVFNMLGQEVTRLVDAPMQAGYHMVTFDASTLASGVYFYRIETEAFTSMKKMVMVK